MMEATDYKKLKVQELRDILTSRGESHKGMKKDELIAKCVSTEIKEEDSTAATTTAPSDSLKTDEPAAELDHTEAQPSSPSGAEAMDDEHKRSENCAENDTGKSMGRKKKEN